MSAINRQDLLKVLIAYLGNYRNGMQQALADEILSLQKLREKDIPKYDWEVNSFSSLTNIWPASCTSVDWIEESIQTGRKIHSVKRIQDKETFTVGDYTTAGKIISFWIGGHNQMYATIEEGAHIEINVIEKVKPKVAICTTVKGEPIYDGDPYWFINKGFDKFHNTAFKGLGNYSDPRFLNEKDCDEYILENKPIQTTYKELIENFIFSPKTASKYNYLSDFFKSKINP